MSSSEAYWTQVEKLDSLHPGLGQLIERLVGRLFLLGFTPKIFFGWRSLETQARLVARKTSRVSVSFHNHVLSDGTRAALAVDIVDDEEGWDNDAFFEALGREAEDLGLVWGGRWADPDSAHVQLWPNSRLGEVRTKRAA